MVLSVLSNKRAKSFVREHSDTDSRTDSQDSMQAGTVSDSDRERTMEDTGNN